MITLAVVNARVWTGNPRRPWASGIAVEQDRISVVASSAEVSKLVDQSTQVIDASGKVVRGREGMIERGGVADLVLLEEDADPQSPDLSGSEIIVEVRAGQIVSDRRGR